MTFNPSEWERTISFRFWLAEELNTDFVEMTQMYGWYLQELR